MVGMLAQADLVRQGPKEASQRLFESVSAAPSAASDPTLRR